MVIFEKISNAFIGGIPIIFRNGTGEYMELISYEENPHTHKVRLYLAFTRGSCTPQTGFIFDAHVDFFPSLKTIDWSNYCGTIKCYWDPTHERDYREVEVAQFGQIINTLRNHNLIIKKQGIELINYLEKSKITEKRREEAFEQAGAFNAFKKLLTVDTPEDNTELSSIFRKG